MCGVLIKGDALISVESLRREATIRIYLSPNNNDGDLTTFGAKSSTYSTIQCTSLDMKLKARPWGYERYVHPTSPISPLQLQ